MPCVDSYKRMRMRFWQSYMQNKTVVLREDKIGESPIFFYIKSTASGGVLWEDYSVDIIVGVYRANYNIII